MVTSHSIAIVGIGGIFPGSPNLHRFWHNIIQKVNTAGEVPEGRWPVNANEIYSSQKGTYDKVYSTRACFVNDFSLDPHGLNLDPQFISRLDPLFHFTLYAGREAYIDAKTSNIDRKRAKVIIGNIVLPSHESSKLAMEYLGRSLEEKIIGYTSTNNHKNVDSVARFVAGLPGGVLAKALGFEGGSYTLDAACASSLYAISLAMDELSTGRADAVLAGGVSRPDCFYTQMGFSQLNALSSNGISAPFDKESNGLVVGEGAGMFMLKRLDDAISAGDHIYCCIKAAGLSNDIDGSLLAPSSEGQLRAMRQAYDHAGWLPQDVDLIECHATGTPVGDAIEFQSLKNLWGQTGWEKGQCVIGSVKSNIGHLLTAAGAAALMKVILSLKENVLPPTANFKTPKSGIDFENTPFRLLTEPLKWNRRSFSVPRRIGINAFGFGGINAHILVEEWMSETKKNVKTKTARLLPKNDINIAITGMETHFGNWKFLHEFRERVFGCMDKVEPLINKNWWGAQDSLWFKGNGFNKDAFKGFYINELTLPLNKYRIPPKELEEMLPQQLLMLKVAAGAIKDGNISEEDRLNTAVIIGIELDLNTTNFHLRWMMREKAKEWCKTLGLNIDSERLEDFIKELMEFTGPALTANRTLGALGGMTASRIAREFRLGGPSFTVSSEETSGARALETAVRLLQTGKVKQAVAGAVDLTGDIRSVLTTHDGRPYSRVGLARPFDQKADGAIPLDGAAAVILKPLKDAVKAGDKIYAVIKGIGSAAGGNPSNQIPSKNSYKTALKTAYVEAGIEFDNVGLIEAFGSGLPVEDHMELDALFEFAADFSHSVTDNNSCAISSVKADIGHSGAASGLASLVKSALCLYYKFIPGIRNLEKTRNGFSNVQNRFYFPLNSRYWLHNNAEGPRRAGVSSLSMDGNCSHIVLEEYKKFAETDYKNRPKPVDICSEWLFVIEADNATDLKHGIKHLQNHLQTYQNQSIKTAAKLWWQQNRTGSAKKHALVLVVDNQNELNDLLEKAYNRLETNNSFETLKSTDETRLFFSINPIANKGEIAFVYPGSGNHYPGMGRELLMQWPEIVNLQEKVSGYLKTQFSPQLFWMDKQGIDINNDKRGVLLAQVSIGCFITDLLNSFEIKPQAVIGYSLGESTGLLSLKVWKDRDEMMRRIMKSNLFLNDLAGKYNAARAAWKLEENEDAKWMVCLVVCPEFVMRKAVEKNDRVYLLIVNTPEECVIGGDENYVKEVVNALGCRYFSLGGVPIAHCDIIKHVVKSYRDFHLFDAARPDNVRFYSGAWERAYEITSENAADSITSHAVKGFHFPRLIENAYKDGVRIFVETGPGSSCCRMIDKILGDRPHSAIFANSSKQNEVSSILRLLAQLIAERVWVNLDFIYGNEIADTTLLNTTAVKREDTIVVAVGGKPFKASQLLVAYRNDMNPLLLKEHGTVIQSIKQTSEANTNAHESFLALSNNVSQVMAKNLEFQMSLLRVLSDAGNDDSDIFTNTDKDNIESNNAAFDRSKCLEFAIGKIGNVLGSRYAEIDDYPTRVRLPAEPMMFVDRILLVEGEQCSLKSGRVVTEHDIRNDAWYLDCNRIPTCVAVEAGQADLFLSGYLGIDFKTKGLAVYRLLDAVVTFYQDLPRPGEVIKYDISIDHFFKHGKTYLFRFNFEATVNNEPLLSMKQGCAGFFTAEALSEGKGIITHDTKSRNEKYKDIKRLPEIIPMEIESYTNTQINELRAGNLAGCFGSLFEELNIQQPCVIPGNMMKLVDRITMIDPNGGDFGLGFVSGETDIHKDDWFLVCHFIDDKVMPGTLMYECCMHTLRIYLLRMGLVGEKDELVYQPVQGIASRLKCRGQVIESTKMATYEISIKETGYMPEPYVICDALIYADKKAIVKIEDMSLRVSGLTREKINNIWKNKTLGTVKTKKPVFDHDRILAFAIGKPSEAFGKLYEIFDNERKIARLPGPPYQFLDRIVTIDVEPWKMTSGGKIEAEYDIPIDAWYFKENRQEIMPFSILLEIALQPCGWLAAYIGSALTSNTDLCFRNLGGNAITKKPVYCNTGTLSTTIEITKVSQSGGMIIQHYDFHVRNNDQTVYKGNTYFGFFTREALTQQIGIRDAMIYQPSESELVRGITFAYPTHPPYPGAMMRMVDRIELFVKNGGPKKLGLIQGVKDVNPDEWFFKSHFYQDPVCPGSLGLESFLQLLKVVAVNRWGTDKAAHMETVVLNEEHTWSYRGQVIPIDKKVFIEAVVTEIDDKQRLIKADGFLGVDGRIIYQMTNFTVRIW